MSDTTHLVILCNPDIPKYSLLEGIVKPNPMFPMAA